MKEVGCFKENRFDLGFEIEFNDDFLVISATFTDFEDIEPDEKFD